MKIKCFTETQIKDVANKYKDMASKTVNNLLYFNNKESCINVPYKTKNGIKFIKWTYNFIADKSKLDDISKISKEEIITSIAEMMASYKLMNPSIEFVG